MSSVESTFNLPNRRHNPAAWQWTRRNFGLSPRIIHKLATGLKFCLLPTTDRREGAQGAQVRPHQKPPMRMLKTKEQVSSHKVSAPYSAGWKLVEQLWSLPFITCTFPEFSNLFLQSLMLQASQDHKCLLPYFVPRRWPQGHGQAASLTGWRGFGHRSSCVFPLGTARCLPTPGARHPRNLQLWVSPAFGLCSPHCISLTAELLHSKLFLRPFLTPARHTAHLQKQRSRRCGHPRTQHSQSRHHAEGVMAQHHHTLRPVHKAARQDQPKRCWPEGSSSS